MNKINKLTLFISVLSLIISAITLIILLTK